MVWTPDLVIYHHPCADGFGAAWACHRAWPDAEYVGTGYGDAPPDVTGRNVLIVDFSYKRDQLFELSHFARSIIVLDHHKSAQADLADFSGHGMVLSTLRKHLDYSIASGIVPPPIVAYFDMDKSGARLAWEFANPGLQVPALILLIEDRDLWLFKHPATKSFAAWLRTLPNDFEAWTVAADRVEHNPVGLMIEAEAMVAYHGSVVDELAAQARLINIAGRLVPAVPCPKVFNSDVGHKLLSYYPEAPFAATYFDKPNGFREYSLRSDDDRVDVSRVAETFGGGGHRNAAGFSLALGAGL